VEIGNHMANRNASSTIVDWSISETLGEPDEMMNLSKQAFASMTESVNHGMQVAN